MDFYLVENHQLVAVIPSLLSLISIELIKPKLKVILLKQPGLCVFCVLEQTSSDFTDEFDIDRSVKSLIKLEKNLN